MSGSIDGEWLSDNPALTALAAVSAVLGLLVILPYLQYVLLGVVLAYILMPAQRRLERLVGSMVAALTLVAVAILTILLPLAYVLAIAIREAFDVVAALQNGELDVGAIEAQLESTGYSVDLVELYENYQDPIATGLQGIATRTVEFAGGLPSLFIGITVTLFVLFSLLRDGDALVAWFQQVLPIEDDVQLELRRKLDRLMWASVVGNVAVAGVQAILLGIGLFLLDVPAVVFLTVATFVLALLPLVGAFGVWIPVTLYLLATGSIGAAVILVLYGSLVSASDTYLRPALIGRSSAFNSAIVVVGIFGGLVVFGAVGLFIGPVVLGGAKVTLDVFARERRNGMARPQADAEEPAVETDPDTGIGAPEGASEGVADGSDPRVATDDPNDDSDAQRSADDSIEESDGDSGIAGDESRSDESPDRNGGHGDASGQ
ncbi:AI-2E family transporter [Halopiger goleimassiliensis]|uniref:AI-2E family transporter n=1 Tax=Halopiger goleimassiliensis TaxID=1293048 RepID=UPI00067823C2|nr:AI-2E family transporter [Halopiger goleimassiliensis]